MATKKTVASVKRTKELPKVDDYTILINCMYPCTPCDALAKKAITKAFKAWASETGYAVVYNNDNKMLDGYWERYGKPNRVPQGTPQVYVIGSKQKCRGISVSGGAQVGDYVIPTYDKWDAKMLRAVCEQLGAKKRK